jgi:hypothetical protein
MYNKYFNAAIIDKALTLKEKSQESWDDYLFHICNFQNKNRSLSTLKGLQYIWDLIDLKNISRLKSTDEALNLAELVFDYIESILPEPQTCQGQSQKAKEDYDKKFNSSGEGDDSEGGSEGDSKDDGSGTTGETVEDNSDVISKLTDKQQHQLDTAIKAQKDFLDGNLKKTNLSKKDLRTVDALTESGCSSELVGAGDFEGNYGIFSAKGVNCLLIKELTQKIIDAGEFNDLIVNSKGYWWGSGQLDKNRESIAKGIRLGTMLGRKLQIRNEERTLKTTRLRKGRIDKRLIASLGFGAESVFAAMDVQKYKNAMVHLSIDASGSMSGNRFEKATISAVAIAKAASMTNNFDVQISYRSTHGNSPLALIAYDSRKDKISKITSLFLNIYPGGTTPEGLCFEALQSHLLASSESLDSYFINFSDGQPYFSAKGIHYRGKYAYQHTAKQVKNMTLKGIKVLSFFIDGSEYDMGAFRQMYGKSARSVNVDQLLPLAKELNQIFI